ncbi:MAG: ATP-binding protein, partial [Acidobacteria bacterium]|nr:ATP-binding protein [Acidobacteriota bacterium]
QLALARLRAGDPLRDQLEEILHAGERATGLTQRLLAFSRKQVLQPRLLYLNRVVEDMQPMLERLMGEDVEVCFALDTANPVVHSDRHQLEQVIMNLAVNARDAMPHGGRLLIETGLVDRDEGCVASSEVRPGRYATLEVSDTGLGMDETTQQRIFEPFFTTKSVGRGTGLGLSMVQGVVVQSGGYVEVHSELGEGATFRIHLPAVGAVIAEPEVLAAAPVSGGKETILVVEDQPEVRGFAVAALKAFGYSVIQAANAGEALVICEREDLCIHLVLTDVVMPQASGRELVARLAKLRPGVQALFMSGYTDDVIAHHGVLDAGTHFIQKPFTPEELAAMVRDVLDCRRC